MIITILLLIITIFVLNYEFTNSKKEYELLEKKLKDRTNEINDFITTQNYNIIEMKKFDHELCKNNLFTNLNRCKIINLSEGSN